MSDNNEPENPVEEVVETVEETVEPPAEVVEETTTENRPGWVDEILDAVHNVSAPATEAVETVEETTPDVDKPEVPGDGEVVEDESPVKKPWTHRGFFGGRG